MSLSSLFVLSGRGDTVIYRDFRYELKKGINDAFFQLIQSYDERDNAAPPIFNIDGINYIHVRRHELFFVLVSPDNVSASYCLEILERLMVIMEYHLGAISEEAIRKHFPLVYEIIDEMIDFGLPQLSSNEYIKNFMYTEVEPETKTNVFSQIINQKISDFTKKTIKDPNESKNEHNAIFVEIMERLVVQFNKAGKLINSGIIGCIKMTNYLVNNPKVELVLSDEVSIGRNIGNSSTSHIDDYNVHRSVALKEFEFNKKLQLSPPEGEFTVMNYCINSGFSPPFTFITIVEESNYKLMLRIKLLANFSEKVFAGNVGIRFNVPRKAQSVYFDYDEKSKSVQKAEFISKDSKCLWTILQVFGGSEFGLDTRISLEVNTPKESRKELGPISLSFDMPNYNISKIQIKDLTVLNNDKKEKINKWIKVITQANSYTSRIA